MTEMNRRAFLQSSVSLVALAAVGAIPGVVVGVDLAQAESINTIWYTTWGKPGLSSYHMSATELLQRHQEKAELLGNAMDRYVSALVEPMLDKLDEDLRNGAAGYIWNDESCDVDPVLYGELSEWQGFTITEEADGQS